MKTIEQLEEEYEKTKKEFEILRRKVIKVCFDRDYAEDAMRSASDALSNARWDAINWEVVEKEGKQ